MKRDKWVHVKVSESERSEWQRLAQVQGASVADLVRAAVGGVALSNRQAPERRPVKRVDPELIRELGRIGNNLNQVARWANYYKADADAEQVLAVLLAIERDLSEIRADFSPRRKKKPGADDAD